MIPVTNKNYIEFDLNKESDDPKEMFRLELFKNQLRWITSNRKLLLPNQKYYIIYTKQINYHKMLNQDVVIFH